MAVRQLAREELQIGAPRGAGARRGGRCGGRSREREQRDEQERTDDDAPPEGEDVNGRSRLRGPPAMMLQRGTGLREVRDERDARTTSVGIGGASGTAPAGDQGPQTRAPTHPFRHAAWSNDGAGFAPAPSGPFCDPGATHRMMTSRFTKDLSPPR